MFDSWPTDNCFIKKILKEMWRVGLTDSHGQTKRLNFITLHILKYARFLFLIAGSILVNYHPISLNNCLLNTIYLLNAVHLHSWVKIAKCTNVNLPQCLDLALGFILEWCPWYSFLACWRYLYYRFYNTLLIRKATKIKIRSNMGHCHNREGGRVPGDQINQ